MHTCSAFGVGRAGALARGVLVVAGLVAFADDVAGTAAALTFGETHAAAQALGRVWAALARVARFAPLADGAVGTAAALSKAETHAAAQARGDHGAALVAGDARFAHPAVRVAAVRARDSHAHGNRALGRFSGGRRGRCASQRESEENEFEHACLMGSSRRKRQTEIERIVISPATEEKQAAPGATPSSGDSDDAPPRQCLDLLGQQLALCSSPVAQDCQDAAIVSLPAPLPRRSPAPHGSVGGEGETVADSS